MQTILIYDIPEDRLRDRIAEVCKDYGLARIQWSAFMGSLNHNRREELEQRLRRTLGSKDGNIQLYPICDKDLHLMSEIGRADLARGRGVSPELDIGLRAASVEDTVTDSEGNTPSRASKSLKSSRSSERSAGKESGKASRKRSGRGLSGRSGPRERGRKGGSSLQ